MQVKGLKRYVVEIICAVFAVCIMIASFSSCNDSIYFCDRCAKTYEDGKRHDILYQGKVNMTLCGECYDTYVSTGELPAKDN